MSYRSTAGYQNRSFDIERSRSSQRPYTTSRRGTGGQSQNDSYNYNSRPKGPWNRRDSNDSKSSIDESRDPRRNRKINDENITTNSIKKDAETEESRSFRSPLKRNNDSRCGEESPKKRIRVPVFESKKDCQDESQLARAAIIRNRPFLNSEFGSPTRKLRSQSLCEEDRRKKCQSTPKSERRINHSTRVKELLEQNSAAIERNLSNNWADIIEELEEQTKELNTYVEKVATKYELDKEKLMKSLESDAETLRKRQKRINYGKVTAEYQRYLQEVPRKHRKEFHPKTPNKFRKCSRRKFDGLIKKWRKLLHVWDENPDILPDYKSSIDNDEDYENITDDFGGTSNITASNMSYNIDDYDIIDSDTDDKLIIDAN